MRAHRSRSRVAAAAANAQVDQLKRKCRELEEDGELLRSRLQVLPTAIAAVEGHIQWAIAARVALSPACSALLRAQRATQVRACVGGVGKVPVSSFRSGRYEDCSAV